MIYFVVSLKNKKEISANAMAFEFEKPMDFKFKAGQYLILSLFDDKGESKSSRAFSIASAPQEKNILVISKITESVFKKRLKRLPLGSMAEIHGPNGLFVLPEENSRPIVFLAGGIGITPVRSMVLQEALNGFQRKVFLFYSNYRLEDAIFLEELKNIKNKNYTFIPTMTDMENSEKEWKGEKGYIGEKMLKKHLKSFKNYIYYIVGSSLFVKSMKEIIKRQGVDDSSVKVDDFGYFDSKTE